MNPPTYQFPDPSKVLRSHTLVVNGGASPIVNSPPFEDPGIPVGAADAVADVVRTGRTNYWGGGPKAKELEAAVSTWLGRKFAFFQSSGSSALITAVFAAEATDGKRVVLGSSGFVAAINAVYHNRARPFFLRTNPATLQATADGYVADQDHQPAALLLTHFLGNLVDVPEIASVVGAKRVIEDSGQAQGARLDGRLAGSIGDIGSLAGSHKKLITAGQGGLNVTNDPLLLHRMRTVGHHGKGARRVGEFPGYNFRGGEMEAVLALHSLAELDHRVTLRNETAGAIQQALSASGIATVGTLGDRAHPSWFDVALVLPEEWGSHRDSLIRALQAENVPADTYPSLIEMPWVKPWMASMGWWDEYHEELLQHERDLWGRVIVLGTQMSPADGAVSGAALARVLTGTK